MPAVTKPLDPVLPAERRHPETMYQHYRKVRGRRRFCCHNVLLWSHAEPADALAPICAESYSVCALTDPRTGPTTVGCYPAMAAFGDATGRGTNGT